VRQILAAAEIRDAILPALPAQTRDVQTLLPARPVRLYPWEKYGSDASDDAHPEPSSSDAIQARPELQAAVARRSDVHAESPPAESPEVPCKSVAAPSVASPRDAPPAQPPQAQLKAARLRIQTAEPAQRNSPAQPNLEQPAQSEPPAQWKLETRWQLPARTQPQALQALPPAQKPGAPPPPGSPLPLDSGSLPNLSVRAQPQAQPQLADAQ
jgi:hypothetical protein